MPAAGYVTVALAVVVVLVLAAFLLGIARVLIDVNKRLDNVIGAVGSIASATAPVDGVVRSINGNLATARNVLNGLLESKVGANGAAELVASVDPLAEAPATQRHEPIQYERAYEEEVPEPEAPPAPTGAPIQYERAYEEAPEAPPWGAPPAEDDAIDEPDRISVAYPPGQPTFEPLYEPEPEPEPVYEDEPPPPAESDRISIVRSPDEPTFEPLYEPEPPAPAPPEPEPPPAPAPPEPEPPAAAPQEPGPPPATKPPGGGGGSIRLNRPEE